MGLVLAGCTSTPRHYATKAEYANPHRTAEIHYYRGYHAGWDHVKGLCEYHPHRGDVPGYAGDAWRYGYHHGVHRQPSIHKTEIHIWADAQTSPEPSALEETPPTPDAEQDAEPAEPLG